LFCIAWRRPRRVFAIPWPSGCTGTRSA